MTIATVPPATLPPATVRRRASAVPPATPAPRVAQLNALLARADDALLARNYDAAIAAYDEALGVDAQNAQARQGRSTAIQARTLARPRPRSPAGKGFVAGRTRADERRDEGGRRGPGGLRDAAGRWW